MQKAVNKLKGALFIAEIKRTTVMYLIRQSVNWHTIWFGKEHWDYLFPLLLKASIMFIAVLLVLRLMGRRGIMQGIFQVLTIIMLGSAAGDPILYSEVGIVPAATAIIFIAVLYRMADYFISEVSWIETVVEGRAVRLIKDSQFEIRNFKKHELRRDEIYADLRQQGVSHIGQVQRAYIEAGGAISVFYYPDEEVKHGLPLFPELHLQTHQVITEQQFYSCNSCAYTAQLEPVNSYQCPVCGNKKWVLSINDKRVK